MFRLLTFLAGMFAATSALAAVGDACQELTGLQVAVGFVSWLGFLKVLAIVIGVASVLVLGRHYVMLLVMAFAMIPIVVYEALGYGAALTLLYFATKVGAADQFWYVFGGALFLGGMFMLTCRRFDSENPSMFFGVLTALWAPIAIYFNSDAVGFLAVLSFMGMLGFSAAVIPMGYVVGFTDKDSVGRATAAAFIVTAMATFNHIMTSGGAKVLNVTGTTYNNPFQWGALWIGPFVLFLGLLIVASRYYDWAGGRGGRSNNYIARQFLPIVMGIVATMIGTTYGVPHLAGIGGTFFVLYLIEKASDIPIDGMVGYATVGLVTASILGVGVWWAQHHMDVIQPYLLF
jgi:hypothetical protein